jgi:hypothetical protein
MDNLKMILFREEELINQMKIDLLMENGKITLFRILNLYEKIIFISLQITMPKK